MIVETQYNIGEKVWVIKPNYNTGVVEIFDSYISSININNIETTYYLSDIDGDYTDKDLQPYDRDITGYVKLCMSKIRDREKTKQAVETINNMQVNIGGVQFE